MKIHKLKIKQEFADAHLKGLKPWELRLNDRNYQVGDLIEFHVIENGNVFTREITFILQIEKYGLKPDFCVLTIKDPKL